MSDNNPPWMQQAFAYAVVVGCLACAIGAFMVVGVTLMVHGTCCDGGPPAFSNRIAGMVLFVIGAGNAFICTRAAMSRLRTHSRRLRMLNVGDLQRAGNALKNGAMLLWGAARRPRHWLVRAFDVTGRAGWWVSVATFRVVVVAFVLFIGLCTLLGDKAAIDTGLPVWLARMVGTAWAALGLWVIATGAHWLIVRVRRQYRRLVG